MKFVLPLLAIAFAACQPAPGPAEVTGTMTPEAKGQRLRNEGTTAGDTALSGTFGGAAPTPPQSSTAGYHEGAAGTAPPPTDTGGVPPARTAT